MSRTESILHYFEGINRIPRQSGNRGPISRYLTDWGHSRRFRVLRDDWDNLLIQVPASSGYEDAPVVILQGHMDMVCEKIPESDHDFAKDPITCLEEGDWMRGEGTSLGADNGIAIALAMDLVSDPAVEHPPLELLFTADEEIGLVGANNLEEGFLKGRILINLDSEDEGIFTIGCAGGADSRLTLPLSMESVPAGYSTFKLTIGGLLGGHSGMDINLNRGNALKMAGRIMEDLVQQFDLKLVSLSGGSGASNALCRDAEAVFVLPGGDVSSCEKAVESWEALLTKDVHATEPDLKITLSATEEPENCLTGESRDRLLRMVRLIPHGVAKLSSEIEGLVETSSNLAWMAVEGETARILTSQRSSVMSELEDMNLRMADLAALAGGTCETNKKYPSWAPDMDSLLLKRSTVLYKELTGKEPLIEAIHAGLECGIIGDKFPGMDMISIGPTIKHPHTPEERLYLPSLEPFREFLAALLKSFQ